MSRFLIALVIFVALAAGSALASPLNAQIDRGPWLTLGAGGGFELYEFDDPEGAGLKSVQLITAPFSVQLRPANRLRIGVSGAWAEGVRVRPDGGEQSVSGMTDTYVTAGLTFGKDRLVLSGHVAAPTGITSLNDEQASVAGIFASELLPFRIASWGSGGSAGLTANVAMPLRRGSIGFGGGYSMGQGLDLAEPGSPDALAYRPGNETRITVAAERQVGRSGKLSLQAGVQRYEKDALNGRNLFQSGDRAQLTASYSFAAGHRFSGLMYGGVLHREQGSMLDESGAPMGEVRASQDLVLGGLGLRVPVGRQLFIPSMDVRVFRREDGVGQGYLGSAGLSAELRTRRLTFLPTVRGRYGEVLIDASRGSAVRGFDVGLGIRTGGHGQARMKVERGIPVPERGSRVPSSIVITAPTEVLTELGQSTRLVAAVKDKACCVIPGAPVVWESLDPGVASIEADGRVLSRGVGTARLVARAAGVADTVAMTVRRDAKAIRLSETSGSGYVGDKLRVTATAISQADRVLEGAEIEWRSRDTAVATVDGDGNILARRRGTTSIIASTSGARAAMTVTVSSYSSLTTGSQHTCAMAIDGRPYCWGGNEFGQLGTGDRSPTPAPQAAAGGLRLRSLQGAETHACAITIDGEAVCWGRNDAGQLGDGTTTDRTSPVGVAGGLRFLTLSLGRSHSCGLTTDGDVFCWGSNEFGQIGHGTGPDRLTPTPVASGGIHFTAMSSGANHACGVADDGAVWCWGDNADGQSGATAGESLYTPERVATRHRFSELSAGGFHTCGLTSEGDALCWGRNSEGQRGDGSARGAPGFMPVLGASRFVSLSAGLAHTCGIDSYDIAHCWGDNAGGQLGSPGEHATPVRVAGDLRFNSIQSGSRHTCGVTMDGVAYCWGSNDAGQLGDGTTRTSPTPVPVTGGLTFAYESLLCPASLGNAAAGPAGGQGGCLLDRYATADTSPTLHQDTQWSTR